MTQILMQLLYDEMKFSIFLFLNEQKKESYLNLLKFDGIYPHVDSTTCLTRKLYSERLN